MACWFLFVSCMLCTIGHSSKIFKEDVVSTAIQLVYTTRHNDENVTYHINEDALNIISMWMDDDSFEIISAIGQARKGKSYTLSKLIEQMTGTPIMPFKSSDYSDPCTHGIWMYLLPKCSSDHVKISVNSDSTTKRYPCSKDNKQYIILDIEGSDTETDDEALRYAGIVTLLSSQTFLFLHQKLFKHDIDHVRHIQTFIQKMNDENIDFNINDINLGAIIREPLTPKSGDVEETVNGDLWRYFSGGFNKFTSVQQIASIGDPKYDEFIRNITNYISINKKSRMKWIDANKLQILLTEIIAQLNNNKDLSSICMTCIFEHIVEWLPYAAFTECSKKCDGGIRTRSRKCNTGKVNDCVRYVGGTQVDTEECNTFKCEWLPFGEWSTCSKLCNGGKKQRSRECSTDDVEDCVDMFGGNQSEIIDCNTAQCKWIPEKQWGKCNKECGGGEKMRYRRCETDNDNDCEGNHYETTKCNTDSCRWEPWENWSECNKQCNGGLQTRKRRCQTRKDYDCDGNNVEQRSCNTQKCRWIDRGIGGCSARCGQGTRILHRYCETGNDADCEGQNYRSESCHDYSGCKKGKCFSVNSYVITHPFYERKSINEVNVFDKILSYDEWTQEYVFSEAILLAHFVNSDGGDELATMICLQFDADNNITLTPNHMIYSSKVEQGNIILLPASEIEVGDTIYTHDENETKTISGIQYVKSSGRSIFTANGNVVINGVAASSFTGDGAFDHYVQHYIVKTIYYILSVFSPETIKDYNTIAWMRKGIYYGGLKFILTQIDVFAAILFISMTLWCFKKFKSVF